MWFNVLSQTRLSLIIVQLFVLFLQRFCRAIQTKGNPYAVITVPSARTSIHNPLRSQENVTLWCQAEDRGTVLPIKSAVFVRKRDSLVLKADISSDHKRAYHHFGLANVADSGNYTCSHRLVRPVVVADTGHFEARKNDPFSFDGSGVTVVRGSSAEISCPVIAFPLPRFSWTKDGKEFILLLATKDSRVNIKSDGRILIDQVNDNDKGVYECTATNEYVVNGHTEAHQVMLSRVLRVKSELAWLWPLIVIIITILLLLLIILFTECRKKRNEQKL
ncbi:immunoglobulin domain protein [Onchocerca flexuosa]|uniref:Immunoglobulin domain protein n=1 Tax=Onchocerca flexuosa TaxID=387005 RepID=A0A238C6S3_9BILA|nr:immunoglobulin domain protein [Onchocerca flexuosa]